MTNHPQKADRFFSEKCDSSGIRFRPLMIFLMLLGYSTASLSAEFSLGIVPQFDSRKIEEAWAPIAREIELKTGHRIILRGTPTIPDFETRLYKGEFDFAYMNPYHFVQAQKSQRYTALLRDQAEPLQGIIVVRNDNPIKRLEELHGKKIAMPAPNAFGASLIPRAEFARKFKITPEISYVRSHASVYRSVIAGTVDAGGGKAGEIGGMHAVVDAFVGPGILAGGHRGLQIDDAQIRRRTLESAQGVAPDIGKVHRVPDAAIHLLGEFHVAQC